MGYWEAWLLVGLDRIVYTRLLNQDICGEHDAIVHYLTQAWTVAHQYGPQIEQIARDEMRHLKWLSHSVVALGGIPDLTTPVMRSATSMRDAMEQDIQAEIDAIQQYEDHMATISDSKIQHLLARIVIDEKDHYRQFTEWLDQQQGEPWGDQHPGEDVANVAVQLETLVGIEYQAVLTHLMESFIKHHQRHVGMDEEDRAVDEMRHLGWVAEQLAHIGVVPPLGRLFLGHGLNPLESDEARELERYRAVRRWATDTHPEILPLLDRIVAHEDYQNSLRSEKDGWTVGPLRDEYRGLGGT